MDRPTFERFVDAWQLHAEADEPSAVTEHEHLATHIYTFDGMNWEAGGESPIVYVTVEVAVPPAVSVTGVVPAQEPAAVPLVLVAVQVIATEPANPWTEVSVTTLVLPVVAPEVRLSVNGTAAMV